MEDGRVIPCYSNNFCAGGQQAGLNLTNLKLLKLGNAVEDFGNARYWRGGAATASSPASSAQAARLKTGASHTWSTNVGTLGAAVVKKGSNTTHEPKKQKGKKFSGFGKSSTFSSAACHVVPHLSVFIWIQLKELEPNKSLGMFLWWPNLITKNSLNLAEILWL